MRQTGRVRLCASDPRGNPKSDWIEGYARVLDSEEAREAQRQRMAAKYRLFFWMFWLLGQARKTEVVVIEIAEEELAEEEEAEAQIPNPLKALLVSVGRRPV